MFREHSGVITINIFFQFFKYLIVNLEFINVFLTRRYVFMKIIKYLNILANV